MVAPKNNKYWHMRTKNGRLKKYDKPSKLWAVACSYFEWIEKSPLKEEKLFQHKGEIIIHETEKLRAFTLRGFCLYANISQRTFLDYRKNSENEDFLQVCEAIEDVIYTQKFEASAASLLNPAIIARDLGLIDKRDISNSDGSMKPKIIASDQAEQERVEGLLKKFEEQSNNESN